MSAQISKQIFFISLALVSLVVVEAVVIVGGRMAKDALDLRRHTHETIIAVSGVNERMHHTKSLVQEYSLTGSESVAARAATHIADIHSRLAHARQLMADNPNQVRRVARLDGLLKQITDRFTLILESHSTGEKETDRQLVAEGSGRRLSDEAELLLDEMKAEENRLLNERSARAAAYTEVCNNSAKTGGVLTVLFGFLALRDLRRQTREREASALHLEHLNRRQELVFNSVGDGLHGLDLDGAINFQNAAAERMLGLKRGEVIGKPAHATVHHHHADGSEYPVANCPIYATLRDGRARTLRDEVFWRKDGTSFPVEFVVSPVKDEKGQHLGAIVVFRDVSEQRQAETELRRAATAIEAMQDAVFMFAADTLRFFSVNDGALRQVGYTKAELLAMTPLSIKPAFTESQFREMIAPLLDGRKQFEHFTTVHRRKDGRDMPVEINLQVVGEGAQRCFVALCRDVSERQKAERALAESEERLRLALEAAQMGTFDWDIPRNHIHCSRWHEALWGWQPGEFDGAYEAFSNRVHPDDRPGFSAAIAKCAADRSPFRREFRVVWPDGREHWVETSGEFTFDAAGKAVRMRGAVLGITERKRAQEELDRFFSISLDMLGIASADGYFKRVNPAFTETLGWSVEEFLARPYLDFIHAGDRDASLAAVEKLVVRGETLLQFENRYAHKDGSWRVLSWKAAPQPGGLIYCAARDVTGQKRDEEALRNALAELSRANKELDDASRHKDEFLANMSHELRTPLNAILGLSEALLEQTSATLTPRQVKSVTTISTSGQHLLALINDILDLSKIEAGALKLQPDTVNVGEFCESCLAFVRTQAVRKRIGVAFEHDGCVPTLYADPKRLKQILVNLLTNAVKFTPEGGRIGLTVAAPEGGDVMRFTVWDTGIGIAAEDTARLFQAFTQIDSGLNRSQEGTGLGLALVSKLVKLHGGSVDLLSEPGRGSRFTVNLPVAAARGNEGVPLRNAD